MRPYSIYQMLLYLCGRLPASMLLTANISVRSTCCHDETFPIKGDGAACDPRDPRVSYEMGLIITAITYALHLDAKPRQMHRPRRRQEQKQQEQSAVNSRMIQFAGQVHRPVPWIA